MNYASFGKRFFAFIIDYLIIGIIGIIFINMLGYYGYLGVSWLIGAVYFILFEGGSWHATPGKRAVGIVVVDSNGQGISYGTAALRYIGKIISSAIIGIGYLMAAFSDTCQALHDKIANTYVLEGGIIMQNNQSPQFYPGVKQLIGISGEFSGRAIDIDLNGIMLGRDNVACQVVFSPSTQGVSRHHCLVKFNPQTGMFVVNDLGSTYGTYTANGARILSGHPMALKTGERFYLGSQSNMFEVK
jgi:uncharacterized RDD family membrane protein YckC